jgi:predicted dehydrogenase
MHAVLIEVSHWHAERHARSFRLGGAEIVGVSDRQPGVAERFGAELGCPAYRDYREMVEVVRPDFVVALGRHADMPAIAEYLIEAHLPCAIEKPAGVSADQVAALVELAGKHDAFVAVPLTNRYSSLWAWLEQLERSGRAGPRAHAHFRIVNGPPSRYERDGVPWMLDPTISGGGALRNLGIHTVDAFLDYAGGDETEVLGAAVTYRVYGRAVEEMGTALLRSKSGLIGTIEAGYTFPAMNGGDFEWRVAAANCYLVDRGSELRVVTLDDGQSQRVAIPDQGARYEQFGRDTLARLESGQRPVATLEDCYRAMCVLDEIYRVAVRTPWRDR